MQSRASGARLSFERPDLRGYAGAHESVPYVLTIDSGRPGRHVLVNALTHGNELCGAIALTRLLALGLAPANGRLSLSFANVEAYEAFDPERPFASRYLDEDLNRLWCADILDLPARSREHTRAKALLPLVSGVDALLDLHSTSGESPPMTLCGRTEKGLRLARRIGFPAAIVRDEGHAKGPRLIDFDRFASEDATPVALLVECGQHFDPTSAVVAMEATIRFLLAMGALEAPPSWIELPVRRTPDSFLEVTHPITIESDRFVFVRPLHALERISRAGTVIAFDDGRPVDTPYADCVAVMPSLAPARGETAVRLARRTRFENVAGAPPPQC